jgi:tetratricopeptide (TPR) repeat protein
MVLPSVLADCGPYLAPLKSLQTVCGTRRLMNAPFHKSIRLRSLGSTLLLFLAWQAEAQNTETSTPPVVSGTVCDADSQPLVGAKVSLEGTNSAKPASSTTDAQGHFQFQAVGPGTYTLRAKRDGYQEGSDGPFAIRHGETKAIVLHLTKVQSAPSAKDVSAAIPFSDEPQFTVAGVTDTTELGVHASSRTSPNSNALARDTAALAHEATNAPNSGGTSSESAPSAQEASLRAKLAAGDNADLRFQLADIEESEGHSLDAVKDYQRAAELAPTEAHLFGWGAELLLHRAFEPALAVFNKGRRLYPQSVRMLLGIGTTKYAQGAREEAGQAFLQASELDPANPQPYLFLGRLLPTENVVPPSWTEKMSRFAALRPESGMAHYLYGFALAKQGGEQGSSAEAESQLNAAIKLDPHLGNAHLQLGILYAQRKDFARAVTALQQAVEYTPLPDEAHYRLAEVYRRTGEVEKARQETALYKQISADKAQDAERERHEIQQFIYTLRGQAEALPRASPTPQ